MSEVQIERPPLTAAAPGLTDAERASAARLAENPLDLFQGKTIGWLEDFFNSRLTATVVRKLVPVYAVGDRRDITKDLTAETAEYVYTDELGSFLYLNGAAVSQSTYAALYAYWGANAWGADAGGNFLLPDTRGRALFLCGTNANADLGDNDGQTEANRQAIHAHADTLAISGAPGIGNLGVAGAPSAGSLAINAAGAGHGHALNDPDGTLEVQSGTGASPASAFHGHGVNAPSTTTTTVSGAPGLGTLDISGAPSAGTLGVSGAVGSGTAGDAPAHIFIGSALVRF